MNKYRNIKTEIDGIVFDSRKEANRYAELKLLEKAKQIYTLKLQPSFPIVINGQKICTYKADFQYFENYKDVVEDVKGFRTALYRWKKKHVEAQLGIVITEI